MISVPERLDPSMLPEPLRSARYNGAQYPGRPGSILARGANCQTYEVLRHFGRSIPNFRSSELWQDEKTTSLAETWETLDLILFNSTADSWGAHVGVYAGGGEVLHLCKRVGVPAKWSLGRFAAFPEYRVVVGAKRPRRVEDVLAAPER